MRGRWILGGCLAACATGVQAQSDPPPLHPPAADAGAADVARPNDGASAPDELTRLLTSAEALATQEQAAAAFEQWDTYYKITDLREHERAFVRLRVDALGARLPADAAEAAWRATASPLAHAALGSKVAATLRQKGDASAAARVDAETASLRRQLGWSTAVSALGPGDPTRLGLSVPLSGRTQALGEVALRGAMMALGDARGTRGAPGFQLLVRDAAPERDRGDRNTAELVREEAVVGIVGSPDRRTVERSAADGVPFLVLDEQAPGAQTTAFQMIHAPEARAAELARRALTTGARRFAILGPDSAAGKRLADAFRKAVTAGGGKITVQATYIAGSSSFTATVEQIRKVPMDAVFVPEDAERLELIAPALAVADLWPRAFSKSVANTPDATKRHYILLLSTARLLSYRLVKNAGRYVQGALLSPGFYADPGETARGGFVERYRALFGQDPGATDAYAYDAVTVLRTTVERGATSRADVLRLLQSQSYESVTGTIRFGADHARIDPPLVYVVDGEDIKTLP